MGINFYSKRTLKLIGIFLFLPFALFEINTSNKQIKAEENLIAATEEDLFLYRQMVFGLIPNVNCYARFTPRQQS